MLVTMLVFGCLGLMGCGGGKKEEAGSETTTEVEREKEKKEDSKGKSKGWKDVAIYEGARESAKEIQMNIPAVAGGRT